MNRRITQLFRLAASVLFLSFLASCSNDNAQVSDDKANDRSGTKAEASRTLEGFSAQENLPRHSHEAGSHKVKPETTANHSSELNEDGLPNDSQTEDSYAYDAYGEPANTVSFNSEPSEGIVRWEQPRDIAYSSAKITLSNGSGETIVREFGATESIELYGELPDGVYGWESVITPQISDSVRAEMRAVRFSGDINAERELAARLRSQGSLPTEQEARDNVQSGSFIVLNGVVNPRVTDEPNEVE